MMYSEEPAYFQLPVSETRFTSNDLNELLSFLRSPGNDVDDDTSQDNPFSSNSTSDEHVDQVADELNEKRQKRKISNRESARRSRWRKKKHLEDLTVLVSQLKAQNREYSTRLSSLLHRLQVLKRQNERIRVESIRLLQRQSDLNRVLQAMHCLHKTTMINGSILH